MKELFPGFFKKNEKEIKVLWDESLITFDTNVILNLYRYSEETQIALLELIEKLQSKIFLTNQVALEYSRNRFETISTQESLHKSFLKRLKEIKIDLESEKKGPFLSDNLQNKLNDTFQEVENEILESISSFQSVIDNDDDKIFETINNIFKGKITKSYEKKELEKLYVIAKKRFDKNIPPGYKDKGKPDEKKYGDFLLWQQIIDKSKLEKKSIILVSDENKEDWIWKLNNNKTIGPRPELVDEIKSEANCSFHMYPSNLFLKYGSKFLNENINDKAIKEIIELNKSNVLTPRESDIIQLSFGDEKNKSMSLEEIAETFDLSIDRVKMIKESAIKRLFEIEQNKKQ